MADEIQNSKATLRQQIRARLKGMTPELRAADSAKARSLFERQSVWRNSKAVLFFAPLPGELDIWPLLDDALAAGKIVALPRFNAEASGYISCRIQNPAGDLQTGRYGIREAAVHCPPIGLNRLDLILVPGVAFDLCGRRLGRGRGFYDQLLAFVRGTTCGVAFDEQIAGEIPVEPHDVAVNCILTPTRWIEP
jgi:5-formyltetrahydrofolate cyclo-ligase